MISVGTAILVDVVLAEKPRVAQAVKDRISGMSVAEAARKHGLERKRVSRAFSQFKRAALHAFETQREPIPDDLRHACNPGRKPAHLRRRVGVT